MEEGYCKQGNSMCKGRDHVTNAWDVGGAVWWYRNSGMSVFLSPHSRIDLKDDNSHVDDGFLECLIKIELLYNYLSTSQLGFGMHFSIKLTCKRQ